MINREQSRTWQMDKPAEMPLCPNCGQAMKLARITPRFGGLPELRTLMAKDPMLRIVYKEYPILGPQSQVAARAALAAVRQGRYEAFNSALFAADGAGEPMLKGVADKLKLDYAKLQKDMADPKLSEELERTMKLTTALDINGTPAFIVGDQIIPGAIDMDALAKLIAGERAKNVIPKAVPGGVAEKK